MNQNGKNTKNGVVKPLSGLCYCDTCGTKMKQQGTDNSKVPVGYVCTLYGNFGKSHCTSHYITQKALERVVLDDIQRQIDFVMNDSKAREKYLAIESSGNSSIYFDDIVIIPTGNTSDIGDEPASASKADADSSNGLPWYVVIIIIIAVLAAVTITAIVLLKRRSKK